MTQLLGSFALILFVFKVVSPQDPCSSSVYQDLTDITMKSDFFQSFGRSPLDRTLLTGWVRYTGNTNGSLMTECPTSTECGVLYQFWMNDSLPSIADGLTTVSICGRSGRRCCYKEDTIRVKNCTAYVVYELTPVSAGVRYCYAADPFTTTKATPKVLRSVRARSMTLATTIVVDDSGISSKMAAIIASAVCMCLAGVVIGILLLKRFLKWYNARNIIHNSFRFRW